MTKNDINFLQEKPTIEKMNPRLKKCFVKKKNQTCR